MFSILQEESKYNPMFLGWVMDNWFGMDPGGGDVKDTAAAANDLLESMTEDVFQYLRDYTETAMQSMRDYTQKAEQLYNQNVQSGMNQSEAFYKAGLDAARQEAAKATEALTGGAKAAADALRTSYQESTAGLERYMQEEAPEFAFDPEAYRSDPNYQYGRDEIIKRATNEAARIGIEDTAGLQQFINRELAAYDSQFRKDYLSQQQAVYQTQLAGYQTGLGARQNLAGMQQGLGANLANIYTGQGQGLANVRLGLGQQALGTYGQLGAGAQQAGLARGATLADMYSGMGTRVGQAQLGLGTNLANVQQSLAQNLAGVGLSSGLQAAELESQQQGLGWGLLGQALPYIGAAGGLGGGIQSWLTGR